MAISHCVTDTRLIYTSGHDGSEISSCWHLAAALSLPGRLSLHPVLCRVCSSPPFSSAVQCQGPLFCLGLELLPAELHAPPCSTELPVLPQSPWHNLGQLSYLISDGICRLACGTRCFPQHPDSPLIPAWLLSSVSWCILSSLSQGF